VESRLAQREGVDTTEPLDGRKRRVPQQARPLKSAGMLRRSGDYCGLSATVERSCIAPQAFSGRSE
jgi:hypothetical protein